MPRYSKNDIGKTVDLKIPARQLMDNVTIEKTGWDRYLDVEQGRTPCTTCGGVEHHDGEPDEPGTGTIRIDWHTNNKRWTKDEETNKWVQHDPGAGFFEETCEACGGIGWIEPVEQKEHRPATARHRI